MAGPVTGQQDGPRGWWAPPAADDAVRLDAIRSRVWLDNDVGDVRWLLDFIARHTAVQDTTDGLVDTSPFDPDSCEALQVCRLARRLVDVGFGLPEATRAAVTLLQRQLVDSSPLQPGWQLVPLDSEERIILWMDLVDRGEISADPADLERLPEVGRAPGGEVHR